MEISSVINTDREKNKRSVELVLNQDMKKCVLGYGQLSKRILIDKLKGKLFNSSIVVVYAPTEQITEEEIEIFFSVHYTTLRLNAN